MLFLLFSIGHLALGQSEKTSLRIESIQTEDSNKLGNKILKCETEIVNTFLSFGAFSVVNREHSDLIEKELERQKSESFIDGKVVEQGKGIGAEYLIKGRYNRQSKTMELLAIEVGSENIYARQEQKVDFDAPSKYFLRQVNKLSTMLANQLIENDKITVVRSLLDKGKETKKVLIAGGESKGLIKGQKIQIFVIEAIILEEGKLERFSTIGTGKIEEVENENFSKVKINVGGKNIFKALHTGDRLFAKIINK